MAAWEAQQARQRQGNEDAAWKQACVPQRHKAKKFASPETPWSKKLDALTAMLETGFLVGLIGKRGTGKTQLAVELMRRHVFDSSGGLVTCLYVRAADIFMAIKESYRKDGPAEREQLSRFITPKLLVIDEAHERSETEWENRLLTYAVDQRYGELRDTLLISNQEAAAFQDSIGPSIYSRLIETGGLGECDWPSFRQAQVVASGPDQRKG